jgi:hypothetical protein
MNEATPTDWSKVPEAMEESLPRYAMDNKLHVQFYNRPMLQHALSEEAGRPIYADVDHVRIMVPGDKLSIIDRIASTDDQQRFADRWAKYRAGQGEQVVGTRLEAVPWMTRSKVEEYKFFHLHTVEQLANANDNVGQKFPSFHSDKQKAQAFLEATTGDSARIRELEAQVAELMKSRGTAPSPTLEPEVKAVVAANVAKMENKK